MKKLICIFAILAASIFSASAENVIIEKNYSLKNFRGLSISNTFDVTVEKADSYSIHIAVLDEYAPYLDVRVIGGVLNLGFRNLPRKLSATGYIKSAAVAKITMPSLERLSLSGASHFEAKGSFDIGSAPFQMTVSGASEVKRVEIFGGDAMIDVSGASRANISGSFVDIEMDLSGASRTALTADGEDLRIEASGTAVAESEGEYENAEFETSGVSNITVNGMAATLNVDASGTSSVDALNMHVDTAEVNLSGASVCKTDVSGSLKTECTGASTLSYKAYDNLKLDLREMSRTSTLKKL